MESQFGPKFYFVHDHLLKIVEGRPLTAEHPVLKSQRYPIKTKFGTFFGRFQFGLFDTSAAIPELQVCVYPSCDNLFKTRKEAEKRLRSIYENINKYIDGKIASLKEDKKIIDREIRELQRGKYEI